LSEAVSFIATAIHALSRVESYLADHPSYRLATPYPVA
jgi:hypothetical protein